MRVLLIDPPFQRFMGFRKYGLPLGLLSIASVLRDGGHDAWVWDADYNPDGKAFSFSEKLERYDLYLDSLRNRNHSEWRRIAEKIESIGPDIVGMSVITPKVPSALKTASLARGAKVVFGGPHAWLHPEDLALPGATVVRGEGERFLDCDLCKPVVSMPRIHLDNIPYPSRFVLDEIHNYDPNHLGMVMASRGCPFNCSFCCSPRLWGRKVRFRRNESLRSELTELIGLGCNELYFVDDTWTCSKKEVERLCHLMEEFDFRWSCLARADTCDMEMLYRIKSAGCSSVKVGVETCSDRLLAVLNKRETLDDYRRYADSARSVGMAWSAYLMVNLPGETEADVSFTAREAERLNPDAVSIGVFTPYPGTAIFDRMNLDRLDWKLYNHQSPHGAIGGLSLGIIRDMFRWADEYNKKKSYMIKKQCTATD